MNEEEFMRLADAVVTREATHEESQRLEAALLLEARRGRIYYEQACVHESLRALFDHAASTRVREAVIASLQSTGAEGLSARVMDELRSPVACTLSKARSSSSRRAAAGFKRCLAGAALLALAAFVFWSWKQTTPEAVVVRAGTSVEQKGNLRTMRSGMPLQNGDTIVASDVEGVFALPGEGISVLVEPHSKARLSLEAKAITIRLVTGAVNIEAAHRGSRRRFTVETDLASALITGTKFRVSTHAGLSRLEVAQGEVAFSQKSGGGRIVVGAGQAAAAAPEGLTTSSLSPLNTKEWRVRKSQNSLSQWVPYESDTFQQTFEKQEPGEWLEIDLGAESQISKLAIRSKVNATPGRLLVFSSSDGLHWLALSDALSGARNEILLRPVKIRYLRLELDGVANAPWSLEALETYP